MFNDKRIAFIGPGMMAQAMIAGLVREKVIAPERVLVSGPRQERVDELKERYGVAPYTDNAEAVKEADVVVLAVKPQRLEKVLIGIAGRVKPEALVLSIVAGAPIKLISGIMRHEIVRPLNAQHPRSDRAGDYGVDRGGQGL